MAEVLAAPSSSHLRLRPCSSGAVGTKPTSSFVRACRLRSLRCGATRRRTTVAARPTGPAPRCCAGRRSARLQPSGRKPVLRRRGCCRRAVCAVPSLRGSGYLLLRGARPQLFLRSVQEGVRIEQAGRVLLFMIGAQTGQGDAVGLLAANQSCNKTRCFVYVIAKQREACQLGITAGFHFGLRHRFLRRC